MITQVSDSLHTKLINAFESRSLLEGDLQVADAGSQDLAGLKKQAFARFESQGFPTVKWEDWKHTNLQGILRSDYGLVDQRPSNLSMAEIEQFDIPGLDAYRIVLVNGVYQEHLSAKIPVEGVRLMPIAQAIGDDVFAKHFTSYADKTDNPFVALNTALFDGGVFLHLMKNVVLDKPIHLVRISTAEEALFSQTRSLFVLETLSSCEIAESFVGLNQSAHTLNTLVGEIVLEAQADLQHYMIQTSSPQSRYINHLEISQHKESLYNNYNVNFPGAEFVRNDINLRMDSDHVEGHLYGIVLINNQQFVDNHTIVDHRLPHCESYEWYKTITQDESTSVFNGKIFVQLDAQKTNAFQQNNNMLLGDKSSVYSKPQLEIFADDVKCSHGCTMGQFDDEALFYLRARGISEESGRSLLVKAFAFDVTSRFENEAIKSHVEHLIDAGLGIGPNLGQ